MWPQVATHASTPCASFSAAAASSPLPAAPPAPARHTRGHPVRAPARRRPRGAGRPPLAARPHVVARRRNHRQAAVPHPPGRGSSRRPCLACAGPARTPLGSRRRRAVAWPPLLVPLCAPSWPPRGRRLLGHRLAHAATPDSPAHGRRPACTPSSHRRQCRDREFEDPGRRAPAIEGGGAGPASIVPGRSPVRATWRCCHPHHAACGAVRRCWRLDLPPASGEAAREASGGRDGARMARVGVRRASPAGRRTGSGGEEAARWRTVAAGGASTPEALHD